LSQVVKNCSNESFLKTAEAVEILECIEIKTIERWVKLFLRHFVYVFERFYFARNKGNVFVAIKKGKKSLIGWLIS
jgi:hypothetical protein